MRAIWSAILAFSESIAILFYYNSMSSFIDELRRAFGAKVPGPTRHFSDFSEEEKERYRSTSPINADPSLARLREQLRPKQDTSEPGLAYSLMDGFETLHDWVPGSVNVVRRKRIGDDKISHYVDAGDVSPEEMSVNDVVTGMVIRGMYGDGEERKQRLYDDGFRYDEVMKRVNDAYKKGKQDYYGKLVDKYGIRFSGSKRFGTKYAGGQEFEIPDDYIDYSR